MKLFACLKSAKSIVLLFAAGIFLPVSAGAEVGAGEDQGGSQKIIAFTPHDRLYSIAFDADFGLAVGEGGLLLHSTDGGKTWEQEKDLPTQLALTDVAVSGSHSIAVGQEGLIMIRDGGERWRKIEPVTGERLLRVSVNQRGLAVAVGAFGTLLRSTDYGENWTALKPNWLPLYEVENPGDFVALRDEPTFYLAKVFEDGSILIGGEYGQINRSTDGGTTWTPVLKADAAEGSTTPPTLFGMSIRDDGTGYAAGQNGLIVMTTDRGRTWTRLDVNSRSSLYDIVSTPDGHVFAVGMRAGLVSADSGKTWQPLNALDLSLNWYSGLAHSSSVAGNEVFAVGHSGRVVKLVAGNN